jgi:hypothetical protein
MSFDDRVVDAFDYHRLHRDDSFEELQELHWENAAAVIADERRYQDVRCDVEQRIEILRLQVGRQERVPGPAGVHGNPNWTHDALDRADKELEDEMNRLRRIYNAADTSIRSHRIRARITLQIIRERYPDREVGSNPYLGRLSRF